MDFKKYIREKKESKEAPEETTAVMAFGRFNPPTVGHEKLIQKVHAVAKEHDGEAHVVASHSQGTMKDPLPQDKKLGYLRSISHGQVNVSGSSKEKPSLFHVASDLHNAGHSHLVMVAGSDRVDEYQKTLDKYNGVHGKHGYYNFKSIKVISAGQRDPDAEGVEGMSGTKMREHAREGRKSQFSSGLPDALKSHADEIINHIKSVKEDYENPYRFDWGTPEGTEYMKKITPGMKIECGIGEVWSKSQGKCVPLREAYLNEEIFNMYDMVETNKGDRGEIVYRGSTYVTIMKNNGDTVKCWLDDVRPTVSEEVGYPRYVRNYRTEKKIPVLLMKHTKEISEDKDTADFKMVPRKNPEGKIIWSKHRTGKIRTLNRSDSGPDDVNNTANTNMYGGVQEMVYTRDINYTSNKDARMGIDKTCDDQSVNGRPVGMISFRTFIQNNLEYRIDAAKTNLPPEENT
jgi:hypothetical protein